MDYSDFGLPPDWLIVNSWLHSPASSETNLIQTQVGWRKKVTDIPILKDYISSPNLDYWDKWPYQDLPGSPQTGVNIELLHSLYLDYFYQLPALVQTWGEKAIQSLKEGANSYQKFNLVCKNSSNLADSGERVSDNIASGIIKGFNAGPFKDIPLEGFRSNTKTGIKQKDKIRLVMDLSHPEKECYNNNITPNSSRSVSMSSPRLFNYSLLKSDV